MKCAVPTIFNCVPLNLTEPSNADEFDKENNVKHANVKKHVNDEQCIQIVDKTLFQLQGN